MKFVNCTPGNEYVGTVQAKGDMEYMWLHAAPNSQKEADFKTAWEKDSKASEGIVSTPYFQANLPSNLYQRRNVLWDYEYEHWCKSKYSGGYITKLLAGEQAFKEEYCKNMDLGKPTNNPFPLGMI